MASALRPISLGLDPACWVRTQDYPGEIYEGFKGVDFSGLTKPKAMDYVQVLIDTVEGLGVPPAVMHLQRLAALVCRAARPIFDRAGQPMVEELKRSFAPHPVLARILESTLQKEPGAIELNPIAIRYNPTQGKWGVDLAGELKKCKTPAQRDAFLEAVQVAAASPRPSWHSSGILPNLANCTYDLFLADDFLKQALLTGSESARWVIEPFLNDLSRSKQNGVISEMAKVSGPSFLRDVYTSGRLEPRAVGDVFNDNVQNRGFLDSQFAILKMIQAGVYDLASASISTSMGLLGGAPRHNEPDADLARRVAQSFVAAWPKRKTGKAVGAWAVSAAFVKCALALTPLFWLAVGGFAYWGFKLWQKPQVPCTNRAQRAEYEQWIRQVATK